ncbi:MAG: extracellular solute-binding protein, partial [Firmicutes bacterium]|nr:extracellular solute-binding protein [Bacillota bacterium]
MKKLIALVLTLSLCLSAAAALADTVLKLGIYPEDIDAAAVESHEYYLAEFAKLLPDVTVEKAHYKYAVDTFVAMAEAGTVPTVFETWFTEPSKLIRGEFVADITDELNALGWVDQMNPAIRDLLSDENGRIYGTPRDGYVLGLMINAEVFADAGLVDEDGIPLYPKTWEELAEVSV